MKKDSGGDPSTRLEQRSEERTSLSRGSLGKGSLTGRFSLTGAIAGSAAGPSSYLGGSDAVSLGGSSAATLFRFLSRLLAYLQQYNTYLYSVFHLCIYFNCVGF